MTDKELIESKILDDKATAWINEVAPLIFKQLDAAGIQYNDESMCEFLSHGFKIGYATCWREIKGTEVAPS